MVNLSELKNLYNFQSESHLVSSLYLQISPDRSRNELLTEFKGITDSVRKEQLPGKTEEIRESVNEDLEKFSERVGSAEIREDFTRTLALISCSAEDFWKEYRFPIESENHFSIGRYPYIRPVSEIADRSFSALVALVDRANARLLEIDMNTVVSETKIQSDVPRQVREGGFTGYEDKRIDRNIDRQVEQHLKKVAGQAMNFFQNNEVDYLVIGGHPDTIPPFRENLHSYLKKYLAGTVEMKPESAKQQKVLDKVLPILEDSRRDKEQNLVEDLQNEVGREGLGTRGLEETLKRLNQKQVRMLVLHDNFEASGSECPFCETLFAEEAGTCEYCNKLTQPVEDLVDRMIGSTLRTGGSVEHIFSDQSYIKEAGVGSILHFKT